MCGVFFYGIGGLVGGKRNIVVSIVGTMTYDFYEMCITHTVQHNYVPPSSTVGIQLHVSALYISPTSWYLLLKQRNLVPSPKPNTLKEHPTHPVQVLCKLNHNLKMAHI
jgi:hypothetical protein